MTQASSPLPHERARWYFDVVSPFAYLHLLALRQLAEQVDIECVPVLLAGLLQHWGQLGPAEIPAKRLHVYRYCTWLAHQQSWPMRFPPSHPFNPLPALRLIAALGSGTEAVRTVFDFIYGQGGDIGDAGAWAELCRRLGTDTAHAAALIQQPDIKQRIKDNTDAAIERGVFGVPTLLLRGKLFWGADSLGMTRAFLADPALFESPDLKRLETLRFGAVRK